MRYGAVVAVNDVSFRLEPGRVTGLIGPNGAGKTSLIDAVSGFTRAEGQVLLDDRRPVEAAGRCERARAGVARSFQSLELFEDSTVFENLSVAADPQDLRSYLLDLIWPINPKFPPEVVRAITEFDLDQDLHRDVQRPVVRQAATARHRPSGGDAPERAAARRAGGRPELRRERRAGAGGPPAGRRVGHGDPRRRARHELRDGRVRPGRRARLRQDDRGRLARAGPQRSGGDRRVPRRRDRRTSSTRSADAVEPAPSTGTGIGRGRWRRDGSRCWRRATSRPGTSAARWCGRSTSRWSPARSSACSARTAPARRTTLLTIAGELAPVDGDRDVQQRADLHADGQARPRRRHRPRSPRSAWSSRRCRRATTCASAAARSRTRWRCSPSSRPRLSRARRDAVGRRAADAGARPGAQPRPVAPARRRAVARARAEDRRPPARRGPQPRPTSVAPERLIVEQHAHKALKYADRMYLMARGQILLELSCRRGAQTHRRDRGRLPARHLGDRGGPHRAQAPEGQAQAVEAPASARARARAPHREDRAPPGGRRLTTTTSTPSASGVTGPKRPRMRRSS